MMLQYPASDKITGSGSNLAAISEIAMALLPEIHVWLIRAKYWTSIFQQPIELRVWLANGFLNGTLCLNEYMYMRQGIEDVAVVCAATQSPGCQFEHSGV
ncbi:jg2750 [Pararge aegeria aegeria]|uniref:Jg2750 protein n=1 Tax=Pararge aegeria aegeria TaxID=348720 RepID=A0A8S4R995_9NEOP|nr:jg2750 [Pararge aegeria aegeria]